MSPVARGLAGAYSDGVRRERGFIYLGLLALVVVSGLALTEVASVASTASQREREAELLFVGEQFRIAIENYRQKNQALGDQLPRELSDLLLDERQNPPQRYLRRIYVDPMTGRREWGLVRLPTGGIAGVYSLSKQAPLRKSRFPQPLAAFADARAYTDWRFIAQEMAPGTSPGGAAGPATGAPGTGAPPMQPLPGVPVTTGSASLNPPVPQAQQGGVAPTQAQPRLPAIAEDGRPDADLPSEEEPPPPAPENQSAFPR